MHHPDGKKRKNKEFWGMEGRFKSIDVVLKWWREEKGHKEDLQIYLFPEYQDFIFTEWIQKKDLTSFLEEFS